MAAGNPVLGKGSNYQIHDGADPGTFEDVGQIMELAAPNPQADEVETTHMQTSGKVRTFMQGLIDAGTASFTIHSDPGSDEYEMVLDLRDSGDVRQHKMIFPTSAGGTYEWTFNGYIQGAEPATPMDGKQTLAVTVRVTSLPQRAAGS